MLSKKYILNLIFVWIFLSVGSLIAGENQTAGFGTNKALMQQAIESKIIEVESDSILEEKEREKLLLVYRKVLSNLKAAISNEKAAIDFQQLAKNAPAVMRQLHNETKKFNAVSVNDELNRKQSDGLQDIEQLLQQEKGALAVMDLKLATIELSLEKEKARPLLIRQLTLESSQKQDDISSELNQPQSSEESLVLSQAKHWLLESRAQLINSEIKMLNQELLTGAIRFDLLEAEKGWAETGIKTSRARISILQYKLSRKHHEEVNQARLLAETSLHDVEGKHPVLVKIAGQNAVLSNEIVNTVSRHNQLILQTEQADNRVRQVNEDYNRAREIIDIGGLSKGMGYMLLQQHYALPDINSLRRQTDELKQLAAGVGVSRLLHRQDQKRFSDIDAYVNQTIDEIGVQEQLLWRKELITLLEVRLALLGKALESDDLYLQQLAELESAQQRLLDVINDHYNYLSVHLLWVRSASRDELQTLGILPEKAWRIMSPDGWIEVLRVLVYQINNSPVFILFLMMIVSLYWYRKRAISAILTLSGMLGRPATDCFIYTFKAFLFTLMVVITIPLAVAVIGWQLKDSPESTGFSIAVGSALLIFAIQFFYIRALRMICIPDGLAAAHFKWSESSLVLLRRELNRLSWIYLPATLVSFITFYLDPINAGWEVGQSAFLVMVVSLSFAFYRLLNPVRGMFAGDVGKLKWSLYVLLVITPLVLGVLSLMGYLYTAGNLFSLMLQTCWLLIGLLIFSELARRWLLVLRRRLVYEAAMQMDAQENTGDSSHESLPIEVEEQEVDLITLSDTSLKLLNTSVMVLGFIGLWMIWHEVFPALRIFEDVTLWHHTLMIDGEEKRQPITLIDIGVAMLYGIATIVLAKQLPAVLEIILLQSTSMTSGGRYTVTTLAAYVITAVGIILVFSTIGAQWSQLQWLVAALSVGIGFGLQEIVANFISGIIILFERPIRVGDFVTVGETNGFVTKIRIRATTIRNRDAQELLVPNKEFITGRLLNWSLTDQTTRLLITVGIAYGSDVDKAMQLMTEAALEDANVLDEPAHSVVFQSFGDSSLVFILRCFIDSVDKRALTVSALNKKINKKFNEAGIVIAFPQRDLHISSSKPLSVKIEGDSQEQTESGNPL